MKISLILAHPNNKSFNFAIFKKTIETLKNNNHLIYSHDLYKENFNPLLTGEELGFDKINDKLIKLHCWEIQKSDGIIIIHPNWWGQPPAILKGWVDRILRENVAYKFKEGDSGGGVPDGLLIAEKAIIFNTSNTPFNREVEVFGDPLEAIWKKCIFDYCGVKNFQRRMFSVISESTLEERIKWLEEVKEIIESSFPKEKKA